jgi:hypothetical protein
MNCLLAPNSRWEHVQEALKIYSGEKLVLFILKCYSNKLKLRYSIPIPRIIPPILGRIVLVEIAEIAKLSKILYLGIADWKNVKQKISPLMKRHGSTRWPYIARNDIARNRFFDIARNEKWNILHDVLRNASLLSTRNVFCFGPMVIYACGLLPNPTKVPNVQYTL